MSESVDYNTNIFKMKSDQGNFVWLGCIGSALYQILPTGSILTEIRSGFGPIAWRFVGLQRFLHTRMPNLIRQQCLFDLSLVKLKIGRRRFVCLSCKQSNDLSPFGGHTQNTRNLPIHGGELRVSKTLQ